MYIKYKDKIVEIRILENKPSYKIVETEDGEILCIPSESDTIIFKTKEEVQAYEAGCYFVPMED